MTVKTGRIVWAVAPSGRGEGKRRPFIIATCLKDILRGEPIVAVGCSTSFGEPLLDPEGKSVTRLREACVAVCDWLEQFPPRTVFEMGGMVPNPPLRTILAMAGIPYTPER